MMPVGINATQGEIMTGGIGRGFGKQIGHNRVQSQGQPGEQQNRQEGPTQRAAESKKNAKRPNHTRNQSAGWAIEPTGKKEAIKVAKAKFDKLAGKAGDLPTKEDARLRRKAKPADEHFDVAGSESSTDLDAGSEVETSIDQLRRDQSSEKSADVVSPRSHGTIDMPKPLDFSNLPPLPSSPRPNTAEAAEGERAIIEQFRNYQPIGEGPSIEIGNTAEDLPAIEIGSTEDIQTPIITGRVTPPPSTTTTTTTTTTTQSSWTPQAKPLNRRPLQGSAEKDQPGPVQTPREKPMIGHRPAPTPRGDDQSRAKPQESKKPGDPS
jgi:hypothetical protein